MEYNDFIKKARQIHGNKYAYPKFDKISSIKKIKISCPIHGEFEQLIYAHLRGQGCPKCIGKRRGYTTEDFIRDAKEKFGDKFDYSKSIYTSKRNKLCIICKELISEENPTGEFWQKPFNHLDSPTGMPFIGKRGREYNKITDDETIKAKTKSFIEKAKQIHKNKYNYSKVVYKGCYEKVCIICPEHGEFWQTPNNHQRGHGCPKCAKRIGMTIEEFIKKAKEAHGDKYNYSKVEYINNHTPVCIICPKHGEFWQEPATHITKKSGCPICNESKMEEEISLLLESENIISIRQKKFDNIKYIESLPFDFYLPEYNTIIECQGIQHFEKEHFFNDKNRFEKDLIKYNGCVNKGINILYYTNIKKYKHYYNEIYNENNLFIDKNKLLKKIKKG